MPRDYSASAAREREGGQLIAAAAAAFSALSALSFSSPLAPFSARFYGNARAASSSFLRFFSSTEEQPFSAAGVFLRPSLSCLFRFRGW